MRSAMVVLFGIGVGVGLSALGSRFIGQADGKDKTAAATSGGPRAPRSAPVEGREYRPVVIPQSQAVDPPRAEQTEPSPAARPDLSTPPPDLEAQHQAEHNRLVDEHDREPRNRKWASEAESKLTENLALIGKGKFETVRANLKREASR